MRYSNLGLRDKGDSCLVHDYESFIQILIALSCRSMPAPKRLHGSGVGSAQEGTAGPKPVRASDINSLPKIPSSLIIVTSRNKTPGKPIRQTWRTAENSVVIEHCDLK